jgi:hypothetical protein
VQPASGNVQRVIAQVQQRVHGLVRDHPNIAAFAAVTSGWTAAGDQFLPPKSGDSVAAMAALHANLGPINKHDFQVEISNFGTQISNFKSWSSDQITTSNKQSRN